MPKLKKGPIRENSNTLQIYCAIIKAGRPLTVYELLHETDISSGRLYPMLQVRVHNHILVDNETKGEVTYDLTTDGYQQVRPTLARAGVEEDILQLADQRFTPAN